MKSRDSVVYTPVSLGPDTDDEETLVNEEVYKNGNYLKYLSEKPLYYIWEIFIIFFLIYMFYSVFNGIYVWH